MITGETVAVDGGALGASIAEEASAMFDGRIGMPRRRFVQLFTSISQEKQGSRRLAELHVESIVVVMTNGNTDALTELHAIAVEALACLHTCHQISPFSARLSAFDLDDAYRVTAAIRQMRERRGEMPVGRKIGFTNRTVWAEYGPIWGYVYNRTVHNLAEIGGTFSLVGLAEPRIEPESKKVTPRSTAAWRREIISFLSGSGWYDQLIPMHPSPSSEASRLLFPSLRFSIVLRLLHSVGDFWRRRSSVTDTVRHSLLLQGC